MDDDRTSGGRTRPSSEAVLRFATDKIGCLLPILALSAILFAYAALTGGDPASHSRLDRFLVATRSLSLGRVNIPVLLIALYMAWGFFRMGMRWADVVAIRATEQGLLFHWTILRRRSVAWSEVRWAEVGTKTLRAFEVPEVRVFLTDRVVGIGGFDDQEGAAERFVEVVRAHAGG
jgi:hypothetical protein